jgi:hypothetical protein
MLLIETRIYKENQRTTIHDKINYLGYPSLQVPYNLAIVLQVYCQLKIIFQVRNVFFDPCLDKKHAL